jgi:hypothetical protein
MKIAPVVRYDFWAGQHAVSRTEGACPNCRVDLRPFLLGHMRHMLARVAFHRHLEEHGCAAITGFGSCPTAMMLFNSLPDGERILIG